MGDSNVTVYWILNCIDARREEARSSGSLMQRAFLVSSRSGANRRIGLGARWQKELESQGAVLRSGRPTGASSLFCSLLLLLQKL